MAEKLSDEQHAGYMMGGNAMASCYIFHGDGSHGGRFIIPRDMITLYILAWQVGGTSNHNGIILRFHCIGARVSGRAYLQSVFCA